MTRRKASQQPRLAILLEDARWRDLGDVRHWGRRAAAAALRACHKGQGDIAIALTNDAALRALNRQWRGKDKATNVLSFPRAGELGAGDIAIAYETLLREAHEADKAPDDHLAHLVVHGVLHLLGFDHRTKRQAHVMETLEIDILRGLGIADPYAKTKPFREAGRAA